MKGERQHTDFNEYDDTPVTCPRCGSTQIHAEKIAYGQFLSHKILISCLKCGHQFRLKKQPIPDRLSLHPLERTKGLYVTCPNCGKLSGTACYACPKCGRKFLQEDFDKARKIKGTGCFTVIVIGGLVVSLLFM